MHGAGKGLCWLSDLGHSDIQSLCHLIKRQKCQKKKNQGFASVKSSKISSKASNWHASSKSCCAEIGVEVCHCNDYLFVLLLQMFCLASGKETLVCPLLCQAGKTQISLPRLFMCSNSFSFFCLLWPIYKTAEQWFKAAGLHITTENPHEL